MNKTSYATDTGRILGHWVADLFIYEANATESLRFVDGHWETKTHYILNGQATERPTSPVTLSDLTLQSVPAGSALMINGERYENVEGDVELEFPLPGTYRLRVECWPYKDWEGEVVV